MLALSAYLGFQPQTELAVGQESFFDLREGVFSSVPPAHLFYLEPVQTQQILDLLEAPLEQCHTVVLTRPERKALLKQLLQFYHLHVTGFTEINTPDVLEMVME